MEPDSLRGTALARFTGVAVSDECACSHPFGKHFQSRDKTYGTNVILAEFRCSECNCLDFTLNVVEERMATPISKQAQQNGYDLGQKFAKVFTVREDADYQDRVALGMYFANQQGLTLETGAAFVNGFVEGLDTSRKARARHMSLEDKIDMLLERELEKKLGPATEKTND